MNKEMEQRLIKYEDERWERTSEVIKWVRFKGILSRAIHELNMYKGDELFDFVDMLEAILSYTLARKYIENDATLLTNLTGTFADFMTKYGDVTFGSNKYFVQRFVTECIFKKAQRIFKVSFTIISEGQSTNGSVFVKAEDAKKAVEEAYDYLTDCCDTAEDSVFIGADVIAVNDDIIGVSIHKPAFNTGNSDN